MNAKELKTALTEGRFDSLLKSIYFDNFIQRRKRIANAIDSFVSIYGNRSDTMILSVPGRSEISGNHTDHNYGKVVAASVDCDIIAIAAPSSSRCVKIKSEGYPGDTISLDNLEKGDSPNFKSAALVCGMCKAFENAGYKIGGLDAYTTSNVLKGSGLSSSAAFEVMVGNILNHIYNGGKVDNKEIARMAQWSENNYFGKPCGLMDQMACAVGGFVNIDFADPSSPVVVKKEFDIGKYGYELCIVNTGGSHSDLNEDYASVPSEMKKVAEFFGKEVLRGISMQELIAKSLLITEKLGDRAFLRAMHFIRENERVDQIVKAMDDGNIGDFLSVIEESGLSSFRFLQNVFSSAHPQEQGISLAIALSEEFFSHLPKDKKAVCRVHGGGFAGTMQAFVPKEYTNDFKKYIDGIFGDGSCMIMNVRPLGAVRIA